MVKSRLYKILFMFLGILFVGVATVGIFLPLLPTTPFLLLAAACFIRSSDRLYQWLITHKWFGKYIKNYMEHKAITKRAKIISILLLWGILGYTIIMLIGIPIVKILFLLIGVGVTLYLLSLKTMTPEMLSRKSSTESIDTENV